MAGTFDGIPPSLAVSCAGPGHRARRDPQDGWLSIFIAATLVPDPQLLSDPVLGAVLPAWLLTKGPSRAPGPSAGPLDAVASAGGRACPASWEARRTKVLALP